LKEIEKGSNFDVWIEEKCEERLWRYWTVNLWFGLMDFGMWSKNNVCHGLRKNVYDSKLTNLFVESLNLKRLGWDVKVEVCRKRNIFLS